jgi:hypothetical protein
MAKHIAITIRGTSTQEGHSASDMQHLAEVIHDALEETWVDLPPSGWLEVLIGDEGEV